MRIEATALREVAATIIEAAGSAAEEGRKVAARLVEANLTGHDSHGVIRVPQYVQAVGTGALVPNRRAELISNTGVAVALDGRFGYGQVVGEQAVEAAIAKAERHGVGLAALRNAGVQRSGSSGRGRRLVSLMVETTIRDWESVTRPIVNNLLRRKRS